MRRWALPLGALVALLLAGAGLWWLMHHDLRAAFWTAIGLVVALLAAAVVLWRRGHRRTPLALVGALVLALVATAGYAWNLNSTLGQIDTVKPPPNWGSGHPDPEPTTAVNILLMGSDNPNQLEDKPTVAELMADGSWDPGAYRSDSLMLLHIAADRKSASVVSIPRDSYVPIFDGDNVQHGKNKINSAFSFYGPFGTIRTVEHLTGLRIDHMAIIDFEGFRDLTTALGGVDVYVPATLDDPKQHQHWEKGWHHIEGQVALNYVRMRYNLPGGDFGRVARQQNFLRAVLHELTDDGTLGDPFKVRKVLKVIVRYVTVDSTWSTGDIRSLALGLRSLKPEKISYATLPFDHFENVPNVGDANIVDAAAAKELWQAVRANEVPAYLRKHPDDALADPTGVS
ncbi:MAG: LCP family protein [Nocardioidaceae bacterium]